MQDKKPLPHFVPFYTQGEIDAMVRDGTLDALKKILVQPLVVNNITVGGTCTCQHRPPCRFVQSVTPTKDKTMSTLKFRAVFSAPDTTYNINRTKLVVTDAQGTRDIELPAGAQSGDFECESSPNSEGSCYVQDFNILGAGAIGPITFFDISEPPGSPLARTVVSVDRVTDSPSPSNKTRFTAAAAAIALACVLLFAGSSQAQCSSGQCAPGVTTITRISPTNIRVTQDRIQTYSKTYYTEGRTYVVETRVFDAPQPQIRVFVPYASQPVFIPPAPVVITENRGLFGRRTRTTVIR